ncbi:MAG: hypothetical protein ACYTF0_07950, partial [Planctomycetota bacterium]
IILLSGIGWGGLTANRRSQALSVNAQLISDLVRQARSTALSTGTAVELHIDRDNHSISGVSQLPILHESFEYLWITDSDGVRQAGTPRQRFDTTTGDALAVSGPSGLSWEIGVDGNPAASANHTWQLARHRAVVTDHNRDRQVDSGLNVQFLLKPPPIDALRYDVSSNDWFYSNGTGTTSLPDDGNGQFLPVLQIGDTSGPLLDLRLAPIRDEIQRVSQDLWIGDRPVGAVNEGNDVVCYQHVWAIEVVATTTSGPMILDFVDLPRPSGNTWGLVSLLISPERATLTLDDQHTDLALSTVSWIPSGSNALAMPVDPRAMQVTLGHDSTGALYQLPLDSSGLPLPGALIDEVRIDRLGADRPIRLGDGVRFDSSGSQRITIGAHPDTPLGQAATITLVSVDPPGASIAVSISNSGRVEQIKRSSP